MAGAAAELASRLDSWESSMEAQRSDEDFLRAWATVGAELRTLDSTGAVCGLLESEEGDHFRARLAPFQRRRLLLAERTESAALLRGAAENGSVRNLLNSDFGRNTFDRLRETAALVDLAALRTGVVVGCGPFPAAALHLHEQAQDLSITALEIDPPSARLARRVIDRHGSARLKIACVDGCEYDYGAADLVYVVNQATPKREVLERIAATAPPGVAVLVRDPVGRGRLLAESVDRSLPSPLRLIAAGAPDPNFLSRHLLLAATR